ncbi:hypothetical protein EDC22_10525 [Tepidamorphus gemmatus]|uniref:Uncharacterized protein n=1 Tax=Tepidamorphus gemmatus TaxID=747076 RepID=A0A4V2UZA5_9HYPH|nr:hypothetical protein EDC22_10525 [Tepidamorphus gemmatus]
MRVAPEPAERAAARPQKGRTRSTTAAARHERADGTARNDRPNGTGAFFPRP